MIDCNSPMTKREFIQKAIRLGVQTSAIPVALKAAELFGTRFHGNEAYAASRTIKSRTADYWSRTSKKQKVICQLCPNMEVLKPGRIGKCRIRRNVGGKLVSYGAGQPSVLNVDPVTKNPLFHFHPGMNLLALAHSGCNLHCAYCQNWQFSQKPPQRTKNIDNFSQERVIPAAKANEIGGIAFTYTEAVCTPEFVREFALFAKQNGMKTTLCTAGYVNEKPLKDLIDFFDAVTVTYKGPDEKFYREVTKSSLRPVLRSMEIIKESGKWLEVATLVVPTLNDSEDSLRNMAKWIVKHLGAETPWLLEKFSPQYKLRNLPPTSQATMEKARQIGHNTGLKYVYLSNLSPHEGNHTYCPECGKIIVTRMGLQTLNTEIKQSKCRYCHAKIPGVWN